MENKKARDFIKSKIVGGVFSGCSFIFGKPNQKIFEIHEGTIGSHIDDPIRDSTLFDLQSITKTVSTAALALKLHQENRIQIDWPVSKFLGPLNIDQESPLHQITFKQLLTHSSGLSDASLNGDFGSKEELWTHMLNVTPANPPGTTIEYTDLGYRILGRALEIALGSDIDSASKKLIWQPLGLDHMTFNPNDMKRTAATPDAHGIIDDEQVHFLGGALGCDGVFSTAKDLFGYMSALLTKNSVFPEGTVDFVTTNTIAFEQNLQTFFDSLAVGSKNLGWEVNPNGLSYAGKFQRTGRCIEKAGGAGTFIWMDPESQYIMVYLTNHGKPKPFDDVSWNQLLSDVAPHQLSDIIYETI